MDPEQIKKRVDEALEVVNPTNSIPTQEQKVKAWLFLKEALLLIFE